MIRLFLVLIPLCAVPASILCAHDVPDATQLSPIDLEAPFGLSGATEYTDVWAEGEFAYLGSDNAGVAVINIGALNPTLSHVDTYAPAGHADFQDVKVFNGIGYFSGSMGTDLVDTSLPISSTPASRIDAAIGGHASSQNVAVADNVLFQVANDSAEIHVFNVANPSSPTFVRTIDTQDSVGLADVTLIDNQLYAAGIGGGTYWYDVSNITTENPQLVSTIPTGPNTASAWPANDGELLMVTHRELGGKLEAWDLSSPVAPELLFSADPSDFGFSSFSTSEVITVGSLAYVAWYQGGLEVIDIEDVATFGLQRLGFYVNNSGSIFDEFIDIRSVYPLLGPDRILASHTRFGLYVIDATPLQPVLLGDYDGSGTVDLNDYNIWKNAFGTDNLAADGNRDGAVNAADYAVWLNSLGDVDGTITSLNLIPEPTGQHLSFLLLLFAGYEWLSNRIKRRGKT